jgi:putative aminopeptidase FrvX
LEDLKKYIEDISRAPSVSGFEKKMAELVISIIKDAVDDIWQDRLGNVCAFKKGKGPVRLKILFDAHMDQIGMMITRIEENGILRFTGIGGLNPLTLFGKRVRIFGRKEIFGIVGMKPPHLSTDEEMKTVEPVEKLFIDAGFSSEKDALENVGVGDTALADSCFSELLGDHYTGSGFDNKAGVLTLISFALLLERTINYHDVYLLFASQEEVGLRGAKVGGYSVEPDIAVVCDVTFADPVGNPQDIGTGKGPVIGKGPNFFPPLVKKICDIAKREDIPVQDEIEPRPGGTDAYVLQITKQGVYTAGISIPLRYMHSPGEIINIKDIYRASRLMTHLSAERSILSAET